MFNKYHYEYLSTRLSLELSEFLKTQVENLRSNLSKNGLLLLQELCSLKRDREMSGIIKVLLPGALIKTVFEKNFIVKEAKATMEYAAANCVFSETIEVLVEGC